MLFSGAFYLFEVATDNFTVSFYSLKSQQKKNKKKNRKLRPLDPLIKLGGSN